MRVVRQEPSAAGKRLRPSREIARQEQASSYPQVLDEIFIDVLAGILPSLEPICHASLVVGSRTSVPPHEALWRSSLPFGFASLADRVTSLLASDGARLGPASWRFTCAVLLHVLPTSQHHNKLAAWLPGGLVVRASGRTAEAQLSSSLLAAHRAVCRDAGAQAE
jgi:hypothetical protein